MNAQIFVRVFEDTFMRKMAIRDQSPIFLVRNSCGEKGNLEIEGLRLRRGPPKGSKYCDFLEVLRFLGLFRKNARSVYQIYHGSRGFDLKKLYRYLRYCINVGLIEIDHIEEAGFLPAKYYRLTEKGHSLIELFKKSK